MSTDFYLVDDSTKEMINIAQDGLGGFSFYAGEELCMTKLHELLERKTLNPDKHFRFVNEHEAFELEDQGYKEIEWN